ncbi:MAG: DJ-1/PfpI family protein [Planctomycetaceae bacterium]|nr:DJ-1/PfpI family protein [Planctomycetaceae bacterium]
MMNRRDAIKTWLSLVAGGTTLGFADQPKPESPTDLVAPPPEHEAMHAMPRGWLGNETIGILMYPKFTALDLFGPHHIFISMAGAKVLLVAKTPDPVATDTGVKIQPTTTFADCPEKLSILFVPGGTTGTLEAALDKDTREFVADRGEKAEWVTSVCTGSLILGAAGLLEGYQATSHWMTRDSLKEFGAVPVNRRVVVDRNRVTGAGVTSGLDFALQLLKDIRGKDYAETVQLFSEYDPRPPLDCGTPEKAPKEMLKLLEDMFAPFGKQVTEMAREVRAARAN